MNPQQHKNTSSKVTNEPYNIKRIEALKKLVANFERQGKYKRYSISVDNEIVVPNTTDSDCFDSYEDFVTPETERIEIRLYMGESPNFNRYIFHLHEQPPYGLNGVAAPYSNQPNDRNFELMLDKKDLEHKIDFLKDKNRRNKKKLSYFQDLMDRFQTENKQVNIGELLEKGLELYGMHLAKNSGKIETVAGVQNQPEVEIKSEPTESEKVFMHLQSKYDEKRLLETVEIWHLMLKHPDLKPQILELLNSKK